MIDLQKIGRQAAQILRTAYDKKQLAHAYLFIDNDEQEALNTAYWLACLFNCSAAEKRPDGQCLNCRRILNNDYPDVLLVQPEGKTTLGIDQIRPLKIELAKTPRESTIRFFIIKQAEKLTLPAANALLNLLEEPVNPVVTILITNNGDQILPTVRSRTQILNFRHKEQQGKNEELLANGFSEEEIADLADLKDLPQKIKYFYQEMLERSDLALVSAHKLAMQAKTLPEQKYVLFLLKHFAERDLQNASTRTAGTLMLEYLMTVDKMHFSNVSFRNLLDYLALQWKR